jgi:hypothetical protein
MKIPTLKTTLKNMKRDKIIFWTTTIIIFLFEGVLPAFFSQTEGAKAGLHYLGYPQYFGNALTVFEVLGALALIIPQIPKPIKELAYVGSAFNFIFASISHFSIQGLGFSGFFPLIFLVILAISYVFYLRIKSLKNQPSQSVVA